MLASLLESKPVTVLLSTSEEIKRHVWSHTCWHVLLNNHRPTTNTCTSVHVHVQCTYLSRLHYSNTLSDDGSPALPQVVTLMCLVCSWSTVLMLTARTTGRCPASWLPSERWFLFLVLSINLVPMVAEPCRYTCTLYMIWFVIILMSAKCSAQLI